MHSRVAKIQNNDGACNEKKFQKESIKFEAQLTKAVYQAVNQASLVLLKKSVECRCNIYSCITTNTFKLMSFMRTVKSVLARNDRRQNDNGESSSASKKSNFNTINFITKFVLVYCHLSILFRFSSVDPNKNVHASTAKDGVHLPQATWWWDFSGKFLQIRHYSEQYITNYSNSEIIISN